MELPPCEKPLINLRGSSSSLLVASTRPFCLLISAQQSASTKTENVLHVTMKIDIHNKIANNSITMFGL